MDLDQRFATTRLWNGKVSVRENLGAAVFLEK